MTFTAGDLRIDFGGAIGGRRFDGPDHRLSHCMKAVDLIIKLPDCCLFVELKDPRHPRATPRSRTEFARRLRSGQLDEDLKRKYRDSLLYEWASGGADKPIDYLVLVALDTLDDAQLLIRTEALVRNLPQRGPDGRPWRREVVRTCAVLNVESWNRRFPGYPVSRVSAIDGTPGQRHELPPG